MIELSPPVARQYSDAVATFEALEEAERDVALVRGGMYWKVQPEGTYLIRTDSRGGQKSLGPQDADKVALYERFIKRKSELQSRVARLQESLEAHRRMNRAVRVGRVLPLVVDILTRIAASGLAPHFRVVGTHALFAYEAAGAVRFDNDAVTTLDIDLLWDVRKRIAFATQLEKLDSSMLGVLQKVDRSFRVRSQQKYTAVNDQGFQVDILRREVKDSDPHPIRLSHDEDDFWVVQAKRASVLLDAPEFSAIVVATNGRMARMNTLAPKVFVDFKRWMADQPDRDPAKRRRDRVQAQAVEEMLAEYLPQWA